MSGSPFGRPGVLALLCGWTFLGSTWASIGLARAQAPPSGEMEALAAPDSPVEVAPLLVDREVALKVARRAAARGRPMMGFRLDVRLVADEAPGLVVWRASDNEGGTYYRAGLVRADGTAEADPAAALAQLLDALAWGQGGAVDPDALARLATPLLPDIHEPTVPVVEAVQRRRLESSLRRQVGPPVEGTVEGERALAFWITGPVEGPRCVVLIRGPSAPSTIPCPAQGIGPLPLSASP